MDPSVPNDAIAAARGYEALYVPAVFTHYTAHLIAGAQIAAGHRVLDVACGTGVLARAARDVVGDSGHVTGLDAAPGMIAVARDTAPGIDWVLGPVEDADLAVGAFDRVVSQFGMMFFRDRDAAARQMLRMLAPGGRVAIAVWDTLEHNPAYFSLAARLEQQVDEQEEAEHLRSKDAARSRPELPSCCAVARQAETGRGADGLSLGGSAPHRASEASQGARPARGGSTSASRERAARWRGGPRGR